MGRRLLAGAIVAALAPCAVASGQQPMMPGNELLTRQATAEPQLIPDAYGGSMPRRAEPPLVATPDEPCGPGSRPETGLQGRIPKGSTKGFTCNTEMVGHEGVSGGFKVERYDDKAGHTCAYYDTALVFPLNVLPNLINNSSPGVAVLDMSDPAHPKRTVTLTTPAMLSPHESLLVNKKRGLLAAALGTAGTAPGVTDIYDISQDCRHPVLQSSTPLGLLGHESGFAPDGNTFYVTSLVANTVTALDVRNPKFPSILWVGLFPSHAMTISDDGTRGYIAGLRGLQIVDLTQVQQRKPNPYVGLISGLSWKSMTVPQTALPMTINGTKMLMETDEFSYDAGGVLAGNGINVGAARLIDISNEMQPQVISNMRLAVNQAANRSKLGGDPGAAFLGQGYAAHYCGIPQEVNPGIAACSFIASGLRIFDIRDPYRPVEIAYFDAPPRPFLGAPALVDSSDYAMSRPSFDPARGDVWYSDASAGLYVVHVTNDVWPFKTTSAVGLPSTATCLRPRAFTLRLRARNSTLRSATVTVAGKRAKVRRSRGRLTARVKFGADPQPSVTFKVSARTTRGRVLRETRRYRTCSRA